jgi:hypothetical protein
LEHAGPSRACIEAMLWLSGEPLWPYWGGMGVKAWEIRRRLGTPGQKVCVPPRGLEVKCHNVCVLPHGLGGPLDLREPGGRLVLRLVLGLWGVGGRTVHE